MRERFVNDRAFRIVIIFAIFNICDTFSNFFTGVFTLRDFFINMGLNAGAVLLFWKVIPLIMKED